MRNEFNWNGGSYAAANGIQSCVGERLIETVRFSPDLSVPDAGRGSGNLTVLLDDEEKECFFHRVMSGLKDGFSNGAVLRYERIFAKAGKE